MMKLSDGVAVWDAIAFRQSIQPHEVPERIDVVYNMRSDVWNGRTRMRLLVKDLRPAEGAALSGSA
jgi:hypothetical protein